MKFIRQIIIYLVVCGPIFATSDDSLADYKVLEGEILENMRSVVEGSGRGDDDEAILDRAIEGVNKDRFPSINFGSDLSLDDCVRALCWGLIDTTESLYVVDPETEPMGGAEAVRILEAV